MRQFFRFVAKLVSIAGENRFRLLIWLFFNHIRQLVHLFFHEAELSLLGNKTDRIAFSEILLSLISLKDSMYSGLLSNDALGYCYSSFKLFLIFCSHDPLYRLFNHFLLLLPRNLLGDLFKLHCLFVVNARLKHYSEEFFGGGRSLPLIYDFRLVSETHIRGHIDDVSEFVTQHKLWNVPVSFDLRVGHTG